MLFRFALFSLACWVGISSVVDPAAAQPPTCPRPDSDGHLVFPDRSIAMRTRLAVNPDGAAASYTPGDHGYTYIQNGVNLILGNRTLGCSAAENQSRCRQDWSRAEAGGFGPGTPEFCVFAMEVESVIGGRPTVPCGRDDSSRRLVGNGKGRPKPGPAVPAFGGGSKPTYLSTTTLQHTKDGRAAYVDSSVIPGLVVPRSRRDLVGAVAWVRYGEHHGFAIVNDTGPRFGEGTVALHRLLTSGAIGPAQSIGPIFTSMRCSPGETDLQPPFKSKPDLGLSDRCRAGRTPRGPSDIRAYRGIEGGVVSMILPGVKPPMRGSLALEELTTDRLRNLAGEAGYTVERLEQMAACLPR